MNFPDIETLKRQNKLLLQKLSTSAETNRNLRDLQREQQISKEGVGQKTEFLLKSDIIPIFPVFPVILRLIACRDTEFQDNEKGNLVFLGIKGKSLCLFCTEIGGTPTLQLKDVDIMTIYNENKADKDFLFYHSTEGSTCAFQSVSCPGWFIGTPATARQTVTLTQQRGETTSTNFYLESEV
ncbi:Interleukin-36 beta [Lemmus lemmus]